jgi:1-acyl-sn-glycerol-3-phosphate acyltransferase
MAFAPLAVLNLLQFPSLLVLPFSRKLYRAWNRGIAWLIWGWWAYSIEHIAGMKLTRSGDRLPDRENAIVISNHQSMADVIVIMALAKRHGRIADLRWLVKDIVKWVPGVGWGMVFLDCLFLKRNWADDEQKEKFEKIKSVLDAKKEKDRTKEDIDQYNLAVNNYNASTAKYNALNNEFNQTRGQLIDKWNDTGDKMLDKYVPKK